MAAANQIIVIKRKGGHGGHHGGAWKVAYADFVTAMMALFIVLWLMNTSKPMQEAISGYFKDPAGNGKLTGSKEAGQAAATASRENMAKLKEELEKAMQQMTDFDKLKNHIEMTVTQEGLRIELMESEKGTFFESGSRDPNGRWPRAADHHRRGAGQASQQAFHRGAHRFAALFRTLRTTPTGSCRPTAQTPAAG